MIYFTLYSRSYCHLCDDMRIAVMKLMADTPYSLTVVDVDQDAALLDLYDELVPVLFASKKEPTSFSADTAMNHGEKLCHYFLDPEKVKAYCRDKL